ncbi:MAG TPA: winged helix-turn-helix domain-containing protein [Candidatus Acidoferrales bacterium]|nr:winged helix-turn-helix domain-containing protein [Candidatus Acidoferrales bacterium]
MNTSDAVDSLAALAQHSRLDIFRLLVRFAPLGLPAGEIARHLRLPGPTLSFHLNVLAAAKLVEPHKNGRSIRYSPRLEAVSGLAAYLMENCCSGAGCAPANTGPCPPGSLPAPVAPRRKKPKPRRPA